MLTLKETNVNSFKGLSALIRIRQKMLLIGICRLEEKSCFTISQEVLG